MKRTLLFLFIMIVASQMHAQTITQKGVSYRYNGKNPRTPIGNVTISYDNNKRTVLSNGNSGTFSLTLEGRKMGDLIGPVTVKKREMIVFNQQVVNEWSVRKEPLCLILCNADEFEKQKEQLIAIVKKEAKKKYETKKDELERQLREGRIKLTEKETELDKAYAELERLNKSVGEYADIFARIDESELDTLAQQALMLFYRGEVDSAITIFEQGHYIEKLDFAIKSKKKADKLASIARQARENATRDSLLAMRSINAQIESYKLLERWDDLLKLLKELANKLQDPYFMFQYAYWVQNRGSDKSDVEIYYDKLIEATNATKNHNNSHLYLHATAYNNLGAYYQGENNEKAIECFKKGIEGRREYCRKTKNKTDLNHVAWSLRSLGGLYIDAKRYNEGEKCLKEAEGIYKETEPIYYDKWGACLLYDKLGWLYLNKEKYNLSEKYYVMSWLLFKECVRNNPDITMNMNKCLKWGLTTLYIEKGNLTECQKYYIELDSIYEQKYKKNQKKYASDYFEYLIDESIFYELTGNHEKVEKTTETIRDIESDYYWNDVIKATMKVWLAQRNYQSKKYLECEILNKEVHEIYSNLLQDEKHSYDSNIARILGNSAYCTIFEKDFSRAEQLSREALGKDSTQQFIFTNLAAALLFQGKYDEAEKIYCQYKKSLKNDFLDDFKRFAIAGVIPPKYEKEVKRIKKILNE